MAVWLVIFVALALIGFMYDKVRKLNVLLEDIDARSIRLAAKHCDELNWVRNEIDTSLEEIRGHVGFEEYKGWLDENVIWEENNHRLGSIFPRLSDLESELACFQRNAREVQLINGLKDPTEFPKDEQKRVLAQMIREEKEETEYKHAPKLRGLNQANS